MAIHAQRHAPVVQPEFRAKTAEAVQAVKHERDSREAFPEHEPESWITHANAPALPIERGIAGPGLLANVLVRRFDDLEGHSCALRADRTSAVGAPTLAGGVGSPGR